MRRASNSASAFTTACFAFGNRLASNSLIEAVVYAETAARHSLEHVDEYDFNTLVPEWNDEGTMTNEEKVLITQSVKEVGQIMSNYVGIVRSDLRLRRAWTRLDVLYEETEQLFTAAYHKKVCIRSISFHNFLISYDIKIDRKLETMCFFKLDYLIEA